MAKPDPMAIQHEAMEATFNRVVQTARDTEQLFKLPAVIEGQLRTDGQPPPATKAEEEALRLTQYRQFRTDPNLLNALIDSEAARFPDLPPGRVPRTVVEYLVRMEKKARASN